MPTKEVKVKVKVLPDISEVERFQYRPGDRFILKYTGTIYDMAAVNEIGRRFREVLHLPSDTPIAVIDERWGVTIAQPADECPGHCGCILGTDDADRFECGCDQGCCGPDADLRIPVHRVRESP